MARQLSCNPAPYGARLAILAAVVFMVACVRTDAQQPMEADKPKQSEQPAAVKVLSAQEIDELIEKAFGGDCPELKKPIRMWIPSVGIVLAAEKATVARDGHSVRFLSASIGFALEPDSGVSVFRGDEIVLDIDKQVKQLSEVRDRNVSTVNVLGKTSTVSIINVRSPQLPPPPMVVPAPSPPIQLTPDLNLPIGKSVFTFQTPAFGGHKPLVRFKFRIDSKASLTDLLPAQPKMPAKLPLWTHEDLTMVPELTFGVPISKELPKNVTMETTAHVMARINHLNQKKTDGFMLAMIEQRPDLRGLPILMGDECRTRKEQAKIFANLASAIRMRKLDSDFWQAALPGVQQFAVMDLKGRDQHFRAVVDALMQILMPEPENLRAGLARILATIPHIDATRALAKLAIFSPEDEVRAAAIEGLRLRREKDYVDVLMQGFRYPLPAVSKRAAEALVKLERKDLLANLIDVLDSPDPRLPVTQNRDGKEVTTVRELVRINHHRNCLLCHAPGNTDDTPEGVLKVAVPLPNEPLPKPAEGGYQSTQPPSPDIVVRLDMTYLRQDFSMMMPVREAHPWPDMQRFDFLVRTRTLTEAEAKSYREDQEPSRLSPYHRAALYALRELTGRDTEPTAAAWRRLLKLPRKES